MAGEKKRIFAFDERAARKSQMPPQIRLYATTPARLDESPVLTPSDNLNTPQRRRDEIWEALNLQGVAWERHLLDEDESKVEGALYSLLQSAPGAVSEPLIRYLQTAWPRWAALGNRRDPDAFFGEAGAADAAAADAHHVPALAPSHAPPRDGCQRPGEGVISQTNYYVADRWTPIYEVLLVLMVVVLVVVLVVLVLVLVLVVVVLVVVLLTPPLQHQHCVPRAIQLGRQRRRLHRVPG